MMRLLSALFALSLPSIAPAVEIGVVWGDLPNGFSCRIEGAQTICSDQNEGDKKTAIIVVASKPRSPDDTLENFQSEISKPRVVEFEGVNLTSEVRYAGRVERNGHPWVDSLHLNGDFPNFFTQYLSTVTDKLAILVTVSIRQDFYDELKPKFDQFVQSLRVRAPTAEELAQAKAVAAEDGGAQADNSYDNDSARNSTHYKRTSRWKVILIGFGLASALTLFAYAVFKA